MNEKKPIPSVFEEEYSNLKRFKDNIENGNLSFEDLQREYVGMGKAYESLLRLSNKLLKIGDSTQRHLVRTKEELKTTNDELEAAFKNLKALSQIGQSITSTLETREIIFSVYNYIKTIMSVDILAIGMFEPDKNIVKYRICIKDNEFLPSLVKDSLDEDNLSAMCFHKEGEVIIRNVDAEYPQYVDGLISQWGEKTVSQAYFPLKVEKRFIGVLALLTYQKCRIRETDLDILHSMSSYIGIAIDNANAYRDIKRKNAQLKTNLEKINELNENLGKEQEKSERLLLNILPEKIAKRLKSGEGVIADHFSDAIVLFA
ncbi:MAG: GAF domain-containing protein, partial [Leptospiraceae bacterium]|nr:GAF domain-containing protein [Leptospiraceae bacterium]